MPEQYRVVAERIIDVSPTVKKFILRLEGAKPLTFKAGQFIMADLPKPDGTLHKRAYSICSPPYETNPIELVIKYTEGGYASDYFWKTLKQGDSFSGRAPFGAFILKSPLPENLVFVGTGTGIAPLRSMILWLNHTGEIKRRKLWLFLGIRYEDEILYDDEWKKLQADGLLQYHCTISRPKNPNWAGERGYVQDHVAKFLPPETAKSAEVYACGGDDMIKALGEALVAKGYDKGQLHYEIW